ncbi:hypothetical protein CDAR_423371 [Caerostris darwini]|uniref:Uncharacterized protein n=1 Tax=Caerostris darwini TaxID=1538125 RepID=A0AAV4TLM7_9ARAC|nr:hypothetical protein CDAR_423371 [Caerostris darwini]
MLEEIPAQICLERSGSRRKKSTKYLASYLNSRCVSGGTCPLFKRLDSSNGLQIIARNRPTGGSGIGYHGDVKSETDLSRSRVAFWRRPASELFGD